MGHPGTKSEASARDHESMLALTIWGGCRAVPGLRGVDACRGYGGPRLRWARGLQNSEDTARRKRSQRTAMVTETEAAEGGGGGSCGRGPGGAPDCGSDVCTE